MEFLMPFSLRPRIRSNPSTDAAHPIFKHPESRPAHHGCLDHCPPSPCPLIAGPPPPSHALQRALSSQGPHHRPTLYSVPSHRQGLHYRPTLYSVLPSQLTLMMFIFFFFLAASGLSCTTQDLSLWHMGLAAPRHVES